MNGYTIRLATDGDLSKIHSWLEEEHKDGVEGSFFCNYYLIEAGQKSGSLTVLVRDSDALPVAFCLGDNNIDVLAVKYACRKNRFGECLAQHFIDVARQRDMFGLHGECAPQSSEPFWLKMGYVSVPSPSGHKSSKWVAYPLPHEFDLPDGTRHTIEVAVEDEESECQMQPQLQCEAVRHNGHYLLEKDFVKYLPSPDQKIEISCDGIRVYFEKNKNLSEVGVERECPWVRLRRLRAAE